MNQNKVNERQLKGVIAERDFARRNCVTEPAMGCNEVAPEREIPARIENLAYRLQCLSDTLEQLRVRLAPVLRNEPNCGKDDACERACATAVGSTLTEFASQATRQLDVISDILNRLEL